MTMAGDVVIVGAGPGDPELVTRAGWHALECADIVLYDALLDVTGFMSAAPQAQWISVGKRAGRASTQQAFIGRLLVNFASQGKRVVRLKGGDPSIFGRLREELDALQAASIPVRIIPGVTAASSAAAALQISLTEREIARSVCFLTPAQATLGEPNTRWMDAAFHADTTVVYMGSRQRQSICRALIERGMRPETPVALVENASGHGLRILSSLSSVASLRAEPLDGPVCMVIGDVARLGSAATTRSVVPAAYVQANLHAG